MDWSLPYPTRRQPMLARNAVATSQPLAAQAGLRMLLQGGNAVDAAIATAIALSVVEPIMNGIGGDLYALVWDGHTLHGLDGTGAAPHAWTPQRFAGRSEMPRTGWDSVTVPGQVSGWHALSRRFGRLPFATLFEPAIAYARDGFPLSPVIAHAWPQFAALVADQPGFREAFLPDGRAPQAGQTWRFADQARTLQDIADSGGESFYRGDLAKRLVAHAAQNGGALTAEDLAHHEARWVEPITLRYRDHVLHEIPPNGQGIAAQMALGMLSHFDLRASGLDSAATLHLQIEAMKLAFADLNAHVADPRAMRVTADELLDPHYLAQRARCIDPQRASTAAAGQPRAGGTVYLAAADANGTMVSLIQSNYYAFGSGIVVPGTGIALHNRGWNFSLRSGHPNEVAPGKKPLHTIIPGFVSDAAGAPCMAFGVMGGFMQATGHMQMLCRLADFGQNPQAMIDAPRFMVSPLDGTVKLEATLPDATAEGLLARGHAIERLPYGHFDFGAAQIVLNGGDHHVAASDGRRDGQAVGF
ncbi:gamma-glutamyltransferase family protein [Piscinibacter sp.]|uniref:gamma-glutamyltransferase family protein n=1 Tax=Piscinibacter sp. TaxID=1903157 RepID=UPI002C779AB2|nr:gamma-glutamyltransferase family protein [Albitalea sp.]HUG21065.1 gamma-glutamyltransferase family protein [Albitalea sp.]